jgi:RNA polymerase sigma-70 factor (ECF subfamily)
VTPAELVAVFLRVAPEAAVPVDLGETLQELCERARRAFPDLELRDDDLVTAIATHAPSDDVAAFCARCRADELAIAYAASTGSDAAIVELERRFGTALRAACARFEGAGHTTDDLLQIARAKLFVARSDESPTIARYNGQGSLESWLRVIAVRMFIDLGRRKDRARETAADGVDAVVPADLGLDLVKAEYREAIATAMSTAAHQLPPGDRHLLRQHFVFGLSVDQLAAVLGVHRATAARRIVRAKDAFAARTRELVAQTLSLDEGELADVFGLVASKLDLSIRRLLATPARD